MNPFLAVGHTFEYYRHQYFDVGNYEIINICTLLLETL
jgi:hypothetical protein